MGVRRSSGLPGSAAGVLPDGVRILHPEEAVYEAMVRGWAVQQASRMLSATTIGMRERAVRRFAQFTGTYPWQWTASDIEEWTVALRSARPITHATVRHYHGALSLFCSYLVDPRYGWAEECLERFDTHPVQICHEWNTARHVSPQEARPGVRPFTREELQQLFDHADERAVDARSHSRKGWLAAFRDATMFKTAYAFGLRRREVVMLDIADLRRNGKAPAFGNYGVCSVRYGKALRGSPPRRRSVLTVMPWSAEILAEYVTEVRPRYDAGVGGPLWPTERSGRVSVSYFNNRFEAYRDELGLPSELHPHCLRHSYVTHLIEDGFDPLFVQQQAGHAWGSTTALYTGVSSDYRNRVLAAALGPALVTTPEGAR